MVRFDSELWFTLRQSEEGLWSDRRKRTAQFQNTRDHNFYDGDETYSDTPALDAPNRGDGDYDGLATGVRNYFEDDIIDPDDSEDLGVYSDIGLPIKAARSVIIRRGDVAIFRPEKYDDMPGHEDGVFTKFFPNEDADEPDSGLEGMERFEDMDGWEPKGRSFSAPPSLSGEMLEGDFGFDDHDFENQTSHGFQQHEAQFHE